MSFMGIHKIFINIHLKAIIIGLTIHFIMFSNTILIILRKIQQSQQRHGMTTQKHYRQILEGL